MALEDLFRHVDEAIRIRGSVIVDEVTFQQLAGFSNFRWERPSVNSVAEWFSRHRPYYAGAESFVNAKTMQVTKVYLLFADSEHAYRDAVRELRRQAEAELGGIVTERIENRYPH